MSGSLGYRCLIAGVLSLASNVGFAAEPLVQEFDGWKITIRPGVSSQMNVVPPAPRPNPPPTDAPDAATIQLLTHRQEVEGPKPSPENAAIEPVANGLPAITPGESSACCDPSPVVNPPDGTVDPRYLTRMYPEIYNSIPFNRAEYNANPSYRHDTTVEFLFGKMRPTTVNRGSTNVNYNSPYGYGFPYGYGVPYVYGGSGYMYPPLQLVVPGTGLRIHRSY